MNTTRFNELSKQEKFALTIKDLTVTELAEVIEETLFSKEIDKEIAKYRFLKFMSLERTAEEVGYDWKSVQKRLPHIQEQLNSTIHKIVF